MKRTYTFLCEMGNRVYRSIESNRIVNITIVCILAVLLAIIYGKNVCNICTVWELGDEAGYLANAAYLAGKDWSGISNSMHYYAYGYSLLLVPLMIVCQSGMMLIRGAIVVNICCVILTFLIQIRVMTYIIKEHKFILALASFVTCLFPYLVVSANKVISEVFLNLVYWIIALCVVRFIRKQNIANSIILGMVTAFTFFVHTRSIVVCACIFITLLVLVIKKRVKFKRLFLVGISFLVVFFMGYILKDFLIHDYLQIAENDIREESNMITSNFIFDRLKWFFDSNNIGRYVLCFFTKLFYVVVATAGTGIFGVAFLIKYIGKHDSDEMFVLALFWLLSFFTMMVACVMAGVGGIEEDYVYAYYGRYYEYILGPIFLCGICDLMIEKVSYRMAIISGIICILLMNCAYRVGFILNDATYLHKDTARAAALSYGVSINENYWNLILYLGVMSVLLIAVFSFFSKRKGVSRYIGLIILLVWMNKNNTLNLDVINGVNRGAYQDYALAEYINNNIDDQKILFVNCDYKYKGYYSKMQVLLKDRTLKIITPEELGDINVEYILTYKNTEFLEQIKSDKQILFEGSVFVLYRN